MTINNYDICFYSLRTQGSTKIFKSQQISESSSIALETYQHIDYQLHANSLLAVIPDPMTLFASATFRQEQIFSLDKSASLVFVDWFTSGRSGRGEEWDFSRLQARTRVSIGGECVFVDNLDLQDTTMGSISDVRTYALQEISQRGIISFI